MIRSIWKFCVFGNNPHTPRLTLQPSPPEVPLSLEKPRFQARGRRDGGPGDGAEQEFRHCCGNFHSDGRFVILIPRLRLLLQVAVLPRSFRGENTGIYSPDNTRRTSSTGSHSTSTLRDVLPGGSWRSSTACTGSSAFAATEKRLHPALRQAPATKTVHRQALQPDEWRGRYLGFLTFWSVPPES